LISFIIPAHDEERLLGATLAALKTAAAARGERLIFVDADSLVSPALLGAALRALDEGAVGGGARLAWEGHIPPWSRPMVWLTDWVMRTANLGAGCFMFATRTAFEAVGGFDENLYVTEEITLSIALKRHGRFVLVREPIVTSGRKLRTYSPLELARVLRGGLIAGRRNPEYLNLWYGKRRNEK